MEKFKLEKMKIKPNDWFLIIGFLMAPMNAFRIAKVGPAEVLCLLWCVPYLFTTMQLNFNNILVKFWTTFILAVFFGTIYGEMFYPQQSNYKGIFTYIYFAVVSIGIYVGLSQKSYEYILFLFKKSFALIPIVYLLLYFYSLYVSKRFLGAPLWYGGVRFTGGANNPHQLALLLGVAMFGNIIFLFREETQFFNKIKYCAYIIILLFLAKQTDSTTLLASIAITGVLAMYILYISKIQNKGQRVFDTSVLVLIIIVFLLMFHQRLNSYFYSWLENDSNGLGRIEIFKSITDVLKKSPIIGLGPGVHGNGGTIEFHNSYLEIFAMSGIIGFAIYSAFSVSVIKKVITRNPEFLLLIIPLYAFGLAGFAFRRLIHWIVVPFVLAVSEKVVGTDDEAHHINRIE